jgi:hypothetical protein
METIGFIQQVLYYDLGTTGRGFCFWVGSSPSDAEMFSGVIEDTDVNSKRDITVGMMGAVATAFADHVPVRVYHKVNSGVVTQLGLANSV